MVCSAGCSLRSERPFSRGLWTHLSDLDSHRRRYDAGSTVPNTDRLVRRPVRSLTARCATARGSHACRSHISHAERVTARAAPRATSYGPVAVATGPHDAT